MYDHLMKEHPDVSPSAVMTNAIGYACVMMRQQFMRDAPGAAADANAAFGQASAPERRAMMRSSMRAGVRMALLKRARNLLKVRAYPELTRFLHAHATTVRSIGLAGMKHNRELAADVRREQVEAERAGKRISVARLQRRFDMYMTVLADHRLLSRISRSGAIPRTTLDRVLCMLV